MAVSVLGGFGCSRNALIALNVLYICVAFILIGVAGYGIAASSISNFGVIIAIVMVSVFLFIIAIIGIVAAMKHHQVMLFFYMVILFLLFIVQFSVACACLAVGEQQIYTLMKEGWKMSKNSTRDSVEGYYECCAFEKAPSDWNRIKDNHTEEEVLYSRRGCSKLHCCSGKESMCTEQTECEFCYTRLQSIVQPSLRLCGGIGLFFSFTEIVGIFIALRYRNQKNPHVDPADFL
ncbi:tetraspanin-31-like isoform X2 [Paramacrobiotus metropolitanus]|uniref:tetraspanin-31-like isoform X2 n=1 Tax=Paramacrobiotus metropolitanus TaxID=2943436 RepID=UPI0024461B60|nr:tetraspanin-31-like isoform X2 [Paramacrobiotus metropolitanus]